MRANNVVFFGGDEARSLSSDSDADPGEGNDLPARGNDHVPDLDAISAAVQALNSLEEQPDGPEQPASESQGAWQGVWQGAPQGRSEGFRTGLSDSAGLAEEEARRVAVLRQNVEQASASHTGKGATRSTDSANEFLFEPLPGQQKQFESSALKQFDRQEPHFEPLNSSPNPSQISSVSGQAGILQKAPPQSEAHMTSAAPPFRSPQEGAIGRSRSGPDSKRARQFEAYFGRRPLVLYLTVLAGMLLLFHPWRYNPLYGFELAFDIPMIAGLALVTAGFFSRFVLMSFPTDARIDSWTTQALGDLESAAIEQFGLIDDDLLIEPVVLSGFPDLSKGRRVFRASRYGDDHVLRYTPRAITILVFRENDVVAYEGAVDLTTGGCVYERINEFFYRDITSVGLRRQNVPVDWRAYVRLFGTLVKPWKWASLGSAHLAVSDLGACFSVQRNSRDVFYISMANGDEVLSVMREGRMSGDKEQDDVLLSLESEIVPRIRELIRLKKNAQFGHDLPDLSRLSRSV